MDVAIEGDRELLLAAFGRHDDKLPLEVSLALTAAADELVESGVLPTLFRVDPDETVDLLGVVRAVQDRLQQACGILLVAEMMRAPAPPGS